MARPTIAEQIQKAAEAGDMEKVKELSARLNKPKAKAKKVKVKPKPKSISDVKRFTADKDEEYVFTIGKGTASRKYVDEDGKERIVAKTLPFEVKKGNSFVDTKDEALGSLELDKKLAAISSKHKIKRDKVSMIRVQCSNCKDWKEVWPGEARHDNWQCDGCLVGNKRRR